MIQHIVFVIVRRVPKISILIQGGAVYSTGVYIMLDAASLGSGCVWVLSEYLVILFLRAAYQFVRMEAQTIPLDAGSRFRTGATPNRKSECKCR